MSSEESCTMMTNEEVYFFDSYACIEIILGNENYKKYIQAQMVFTKLNVYEVFLALLKKLGEKEANAFIEKTERNVVDFDKEVIKAAAKMRLHYNKNDVSMADCIGHIVAKKMNVKFLTGDREFEHMDNVEWVK